MKMLMKEVLNKQGFSNFHLGLMERQMTSVG
jgi:hypothetical protein